ncbi:MAG: trigger factor [Actinomycetota bacterium]|nr:trigger factor [Actinomycetota bacterium]
MNFKIKSQKKIDLNKVKLDVEISNNFLKKNIGKAYKEISGKANIPGFRKGKVPYQVIDANFGREYVLNEAASLSISELYPDIIMESDLNPIDYPSIKITRLEEESPLGFEIELELEPEIELPQYKGIKVTGFSTDVSGEEVERQIDNIRNSFATLEPVLADRGIAKGDYVTLDFTGEINGKEFEGGSAEDYLLEVGSNTLFPEFEDSLIGMKAGDSKTITLTLPENIGNKELAGKQATFKIFIKDIKRKVLPELDEGFLKDLGDFKDVEDFKSYVKDKIFEQKDNFRRTKVIEEILEHIMNNMKTAVPEIMITRRIKQLTDEIDENLRNQKITREDYLKMINITENQFNEEIRKRAEKDVKEYLIFKALEKAEKKRVEPSEEEINKEKEKIISSYDKEEDIKKVKEFFESTDGREMLAGDIRRRKIIDLLINSAKIVEEVEDKSTQGKSAEAGATEEEKEEDKKEIYTPGDDVIQSESKSKKIWTPGSE